MPFSAEQILEPRCRQELWKALERAIPVAHHDHRILADLHRQIIAGIQHFAVVTDEEPIAIPDHIEIDLVLLGAAIKFPLQCGLVFTAP